jgi:hypothetical protein
MVGVTEPSSAGALKEEGNSLFKSGDYLRAAAKYTQAIKAEPDAANQAILYR